MKSIYRYNMAQLKPDAYKEMAASDLKLEKKEKTLKDNILQEL